MSALINLLMLPIRLVLRLMDFLLNLGGRLLVILIGLIFVLVGALLTATVVGGCLGIPLALLGLALVLRGLF